MTNFLNRPKTTWALVLWSGYIATWTLVTGPGPAMVALWSLAGMIVLGSLLFARQPLFQHGPGLSGLFVWPGRTHWRVVNPHHDLEALAADCADDGRYEFLFSGVPLPITGGVGSPVNPVAIK